MARTRAKTSKSIRNLVCVCSSLLFQLAQHTAWECRRNIFCPVSFFPLQFMRVRNYEKGEPKRAKWNGIFLFSPLYLILHWIFTHTQKASWVWWNKRFLINVAAVRKPSASKLELLGMRRMNRGKRTRSNGKTIVFCSFFGMQTHTKIRTNTPVHTS